MSRNFAVVVAVALSAEAIASPAALQVNPGASSLTITLCLTACGTQCDSDVSPVSGSIVAGLDCLTQPTGLLLHDFNFVLNNTVQLNLNFGLVCGRFDATGSGVTMNYGTPGTPMPETPISGGAFNYAGVPSSTAGTLAYTSTNLVCVGLQAAGRLCSDTIDLATVGGGSIGLGGNVAVAGRAVTVTLNINSSGPIDPNTPGLGTLSIVGTVVATGSVPLPTVDTFLSVLVGAIANMDAVCESDINMDGVVDGRDVQAYVSVLLGP